MRGDDPLGPPAQDLNVLFDARTLRGLTEGRVTATYRRWTTVRPKPGSRFTTRAGMVEVTSIAPADPDALTEADAAAAGFASRAALLAWTGKKGTGDLYRIGIRLAGPDPRVALRAAGALDEAEIAALTAKLDRMDRAADRAVDAPGPRADRRNTRASSPPSWRPPPARNGRTSSSGSAGSRPSA